MASSIKLVYLIIVLSIAADFISLGGYFFNNRQVGDITAAQSSSLILPGANAVIPIVVRVIAGALTKSAIKAAKKRAKNQARKAGNARNKAKKAGGKGMRIPEFLSNTNQDI